LLARGDTQSGPYQTPMEDGMEHFHQWYREVMGATQSNMVALPDEASNT
jgi:choline monooxygenase